MPCALPTQRPPGDVLEYVYSLGLSFFKSEWFEHLQT